MVAVDSVTVVEAALAKGEGERRRGRTMARERTSIIVKNKQPDELWMEEGGEGLGRGEEGEVEAQDGTRNAI